MTRADEIETAVDALLAPWLMAEREHTKQQLELDCERFRNFVQWAEYYGVGLAINGRIVAAYLLECAASGVAGLANGP